MVTGRAILGNLAELAGFELQLAPNWPRRFLSGQRGRRDAVRADRKIAALNGVDLAGFQFPKKKVGLIVIVCGQNDLVALLLHEASNHLEDRRCVVTHRQHRDDRTDLSSNPPFVEEKDVKRIA